MKKAIFTLLFSLVLVINCTLNISVAQASSYASGGDTIETSYDLSTGLTSVSVPSDKKSTTKDISCFKYTATESGTHKLTVTWTSVNQDGLYVDFLDNDGNSYFKLGAKRLNSGLGSTSTANVTITKGSSIYVLISPEYDENETANIRVTPPEKITLNKTTIDLSVKKTFTLKLMNNEDEVIWVSSDVSILDVSSKGKITAKKAGNAKVYAIANDNLYVCKVTIK